MATPREVKIIILLATTLKPSKMTYKDYKSSMPIFHHDIYRPKRSFGQGNIFTSVCLSTGGGLVPGGLQFFRWGLQFLRGVSNFSGGGVSNFWGGWWCLVRGSPIFRGVSNFWGVWSGGVSNFSGVSNLGGSSSIFRNTVNVQPVRILLECILVYIFFIHISLNEINIFL